MSLRRIQEEQAILDENSLDWDDFENQHEIVAEGNANVGNGNGNDNENENGNESDVIGAAAAENGNGSDGAAVIAVGNENHGAQFDADFENANFDDVDLEMDPL